MLSQSPLAQHGSSITDPSISKALSTYWENEFMKDMARLHVQPPDTLTRVTEYVPEIATFVQKIIENGFGYATTDGSVYFDTRTFDGARGGEKRADVPKDVAEWAHSYAKLQPWSKGNKELLEEGEGMCLSYLNLCIGRRIWLAFDSASQAHSALHRVNAPHPISPCGKHQSQESPHGPPHGVPADQDGTSSAQ